MGQGKSSLRKRQLYNPGEYTDVQSMNDERYGNMKLLQNGNGDKVAEIFKTFHDEQLIEQIDRELQFRQQIDLPNVAKLINYNLIKKDELCSTFYKLGLLYEYHQLNLKTEIQKRCQSNRFFKEGELWYFLDSLVAACTALQQRYNIPHGDIRPFNVLITKNGVVKLGEMYYNSQPMPAYSQLLQGSHNEVYLSPQLYRSLINSEQYPKFDSFKADLYSIGMTILEAATFQPVTDVCYDSNSGFINKQNLEQLLYIVKTQYGISLSTILSKILTEDEFQRPTFEEIQKDLAQIPNKASSIICYEGVLLQEQLSLSSVQTQPVRIAEVEPAKPSAQPTTTFQKVEEAPKPFVQTYTQEPVFVPAPKQTSETFNYTNNNDDINSKVQAALSLSKETITRYSTAPQTTTNYTYTSTVPQTTNTYTTTIPQTASYTATTVPETTTTNYTYVSTLPQTTASTYTTTVPQTNTYAVTSVPETKTTTNYTYVSSLPQTSTTYTTTVPETTTTANYTYVSTLPQTTATYTATTVPETTTNYTYSYVPQTTYTATTVPETTTTANYTYVSTLPQTTATYTATTVPETNTTSNYTYLPLTTANTYTSTVPQTSSYTTTYTGNYNYTPIDAKASQIETRTYLNQSTNNIETKNYLNDDAKVETTVIQPVSEAVEETVKRTAARTNVQAETTNPSTSANTYTTYTSVNPVSYTNYQVTLPEEKTYTSYITNNYQVSNPEEKTYSSYLTNTQQVTIPEEKTYTSYLTNTQQVIIPEEKTYTSYLTNTQQATIPEEKTYSSYITSNYQVSNPEEKNITYTSSSYQPTYTTKIYETNLTSAYDKVPADSTGAQQVTEYKTYSTAQYGSTEERDAYIQKILADANAAATSGSLSNNVVTTTYTTVIDGQNAQGYTGFGLENAGVEKTVITNVVDGANYAYQQNY